MKRLSVVLVLLGLLTGVCSQAPGQVYEFRKPNIPVNDDSLGHHHHFNLSGEDQRLVAAKGDTFYAVWWDYRRAGYPSDPDIYFARSTDSGRTFLPNIRVNDDADTMPQETPSLCLDRQGIIHIAWSDARLGQWRIFYTKSIDGGRSFLPNQRVNDTITDSPMIASNGQGTVCIAWRVGYYFWIIKSSNGGQTFGRPVVINDFEANNVDNASLALDSVGRAYVAWVRNTSPPVYREVFLSRSTDPGDTLFLPSVQVSYCPWRVWDAGGPSVAVGREGRVCVALLDKRYTSESGHVYVARSTDWGDTFLANVDVSDNNGQSGMARPSISLDDSGNAYAAWDDTRNGYRCIYFARSRDSSCTVFSPNTLVNDSSGLSGTDRYGASLAVNERGEAFVTWSDDRVSGSIYLYDIFSSRGVRRVGVEDGGNESGKDEGLRIWCHPNPFTDRVRISFSLGRAGRASLSVYNLLGEEVKCLMDEVKGPGRYDVEWRGEDGHGKKVNSGVYFVKVSGGSCRNQVPLKCIFMR